MPQIQQIPTITTLTNVAGYVEIYTFYDPQDYGHLLSAQIIESPQTIGGISFIEGELAMNFIHDNCLTAPHVDFIIDGDGNLIVISHDAQYPASIYNIDSITGELQSIT